MQTVQVPPHPQPANGQAWVQHRDACGVSVDMPAAWRVSVGMPDQIAISDPLGSAAAMVRWRSVPQAGDLARWLRHHYPATEVGLHNVIMWAATGRGPQLARAAFDYGSHIFRGRACVVALRQGDRATLWIAAAARTEFAQRLPDLTRILVSLRFDPAGQHARAADLALALADCAGWASELEPACLLAAERR